MTKQEILAALTPYCRLMRETPYGHAVADLLELAWPDDPPLADMGYGDALHLIRPRLDAIVAGDEAIARQNQPGPADQARARAGAIRFLIQQIEEMEALA